jgi:D-threo-aldose 1-dehydrogenase
VNRVTLRGTDLVTSQLGFGSVGGKISELERVQLYEAAFARGITHFDTARSYGLGGAERTLGRFLANKRNEVTITTKLGISAPRHGFLLRSAKTAGRSLEGLLPSVGGRAKSAAGNRLVSVGRFSAQEARRSLETSLRELGTDHVDILLLHECSPEDVQDELLEFLAECVTEGKVRYTGTATGLESTSAIIDRGMTFPEIVQIPNSAMDPNLSQLSLKERAAITHSSLSRCFRRIQKLLASSARLSREWAAELQADCSNDSTLSSLCLSYAVRANPDGIILFSSCKEKHIAANVTLLQESATFSDDQLAGLVRLAHDA